MKLRILVIAAAAAVGLAGCGTCPGVCNPIILVNLVDDAGQAVAPASGTATVNGSAHTFDCAASDNGSVTCRATSVEITSDVFTTLSLTVRDASGKTFGGDVPTALSTTDGDVCGSKCRAGATTVTLR